MSDTFVTIILLAIGAGALWLGHWVVSRMGADISGRNANADPNSLSADSANVIMTSRNK